MNATSTAGTQAGQAPVAQSAPAQSSSLPSTVGAQNGRSGDLRAVPRCEVTTATISSAPFAARSSIGRLSLKPPSTTSSPRTRIQRP